MDIDIEFVDNGWKEIECLQAFSCVCCCFFVIIITAYGIFEIYTDKTDE